MKKQSNRKNCPKLNKKTQRASRIKGESFRAQTIKIKVKRSIKI